MATRTVNPDTVRTLRDWVARWPKAGNLGFDPEGRNPVVYTRETPARKLKEIPWKREADTLTVLSQRGAFAGTAVAAAERRMARIREQRDAAASAAQEQIRVAEAAVLEAWRAYHAADPIARGRGALRRDVLVAERNLRALEVAQLPAERKVVEMGDVTTVQVPAMPRALRGMELTDVAAGQ
jgi:hypothetical protein